MGRTHHTSIKIKVDTIWYTINKRDSEEYSIRKDVQLILGTNTIRQKVCACRYHIDKKSLH